MRPPRPRLLVPVAAATFGLAVGFGLGALLQNQTSLRDSPESTPANEADGGVVYVCGGQARAFVFSRGLPSEPTEVLLPLRGDGVLLPVTTDGAEVLTGSADGHQYYRPDDGHLVLTQEIVVPPGSTVAARVGGRDMSLAVRDCSDRG